MLIKRGVIVDGTEGDDETRQTGERRTRRKV